MAGRALATGTVDLKSFHGSRPWASGDGIWIVFQHGVAAPHGGQVDDEHKSPTLTSPKVAVVLRIPGKAYLQEFLKNPEAFKEAPDSTFFLISFQQSRVLPCPSLNLRPDSLFWGTHVMIS